MNRTLCFGRMGWNFLESAKDEKKWAEATKTAHAHNEKFRSGTLKPLVVALFSGAREDV